jgi:palmitoyltransferase
MQTYLEPTPEAGRALFQRAIPGEVVMLNLLRLREVANYLANPELAPEQPISGVEAYDRYIAHTLPYLTESGGEVLFSGDGGPFLIGPDGERWDRALLVRQSSVAAFMAFAANEGYLAGLGHRTAAVEDSRLLPLVGAPIPVKGSSADAPNSVMLDRIAAGRTDLVFEWLGQGGSINAKADGAGLLQWCAYYGDVGGMRRLLSAGATLAELGENFGLSAAAFHGHWRLCEFLLESGADPNFVDPQNHEVPLHAALCSRESLAHEQVVRVLLAAGADPNRTTRPGAETDGFMRDARTRGETPLHRAASYGTRGAIELLLGAGAQVDTQDAAGDTPLTWASWALRETAILSLLCFGPHRLHPGRLSMKAYLIGRPLGDSDRSVSS